MQLSTVCVENCTRRALAVERCTRRASGRGRRVPFSTSQGPPRETAPRDRPDSYARKTGPNAWPARGSPKPVTQ